MKALKIYKKLRRLNEEELSPLRKEYMSYFDKMMDLFGVDSPADFKDEEKEKEFYMTIKMNWDKGVGAEKGWEDKVRVQLGLDKLEEQKLRRYIRKTIKEYL